MAFEKGRSGNPAGRPKGVGLSSELRKAIEDNAKDIIESMVGAAIAGDTAAGKALLDRVVPALKPQQQAELSMLPDSKVNALRNKARQSLKQ